MLRAMTKEIGMQKGYVKGPIKTIYFGGGTPSIFRAHEIEILISTIKQFFNVANDTEITLEANPDDLDQNYLQELAKSSVNRLSIGVQTFDDSRLAYVNRSHTGKQAKQAVELAQNFGFVNISIDLIYAIPPEDSQYWKRDLEMAVQLSIPHISIYGLTIEEKTVFGKWLKNGQLNPTSEETSAWQYSYAIDYLNKQGLQQYEVANFARHPYYSKHNQAYWDRKPYLGIGPGAHSFNVTSRQHNVRNNVKYLKSILDQDKLMVDLEVLSLREQINEYIMTRLRTTKGLDLNVLKTLFGIDLEVMKSGILEQLVKKGLIEKTATSIVLNTDGFMVADEITLLLFID